MKIILWNTLIALIWIVTASHVEAAQILFSSSPNTVPGDTASIIEVRMVDGDTINALEGSIMLLSEGGAFISDVLVETGDSMFTLWPTVPVYNPESRIIRFSGGATKPLMGENRIFRIRLFTESTEPITISWLGGMAYQSDGWGTPVGVSSRSLKLKPERGVPNQIRQTSVDTKPPRIESIEISSDLETFDGRPFLSVYATDDISGVAYYEVIENNETTRIDNGPYLIKNRNAEQELLVTVYDNAENSVSVRVPNHNVWARILFSVFALALLITAMFKYSSRRKHKKSKST